LSLAHFNNFATTIFFNSSIVEHWSCSLFPGCRQRLAAATSILRNVVSTESSSRNATQLYTMRLLSKCVTAS
jgi:hypothetical protein